MSSRPLLPSQWGPRSESARRFAPQCRKCGESRTQAPEREGLGPGNPASNRSWLGNRNSLARWRALRRVPICRCFFVKGGNPLSRFPPKSPAANLRFAAILFSCSFTRRSSRTPLRKRIRSLSKAQLRNARGAEHERPGLTTLRNLAAGRTAGRGWPREKAVSGRRPERAATLVTATTAPTLNRDSRTLRPCRKDGVRWMRRSTSTASPTAHRRCRRIPASRLGISRMNRRAFDRWPRVIATSWESPSSNPGAARPAAREARSKPAARNTSSGSQQAPFSQSSQTSLRMLAICSPWAWETARAVSSFRWLSISSE